MRVMTFNLRFKNENDGKNHWDSRKDLVADILMRYDPDVVGTQEGYRSQIHDLQAIVKTYLHIDRERLLSDYRQCPTILYRGDRLSLEHGGTFWLSDTPSVVDSKSWDAAFPRMLTYAQFRERDGGLRYLFLDTHLDHVSGRARTESVRLILQLLEKINREELPFILVGDFNLSPDGPEHRALTDASEKGPFIDTWRFSGKEETHSETRHSFDGVGKYYRMDWILAKRGVVVKNTKIIRDNRSGRYPSDHFPVMADLEF